MKNYFFRAGLVAVLIASSVGAYVLPRTFASALSFSDVYSTDPVNEALDYLTENNIVDGYSDGTFHPLAQINRAEFTKMMVTGVLGETPDENLYKNCFDDVSTDWYAKYVCRAKELGWVAGYSNGTFAPGDSISRAEAVTIMVKALGWELLDENDYSVFADNYDFEQWYWEQLMIFEERGIFDTLDGYISPHELISRKQMSFLLYRALKYEAGDPVDAWTLDMDSGATYQDVLDSGLTAAIPSDASFPHHSQSGWTYGCYAFASKNVIEYKYGEVLNMSEVQNRIGWDGAFIWNDEEQARFAQEYDYDSVFSYSGTPEYFLKKLAFGEPLVLYIPYYLGSENIGHQLVAYSFDENGVWVADSLSGGSQRQIGYDEVFVDGANYTTNLTEYRKVKDAGTVKAQFGR